jgi:hypothetical protein
MEEFLKQLKLECHLDIFIENGFDSLDTLEDLDVNALDDMKISLAHKGKLLRRVKELYHV